MSPKNFFFSNKKKKIKIFFLGGGAGAGVGGGAGPGPGPGPGSRGGSNTPNALWDRTPPWTDTQSENITFARFAKRAVTNQKHQVKQSVSFLSLVPAKIHQPSTESMNRF